MQKKGELAPGTHVGRYRIVSVLGRGGMGVVYHAFDPVIDRAVALKTIRNREDFPEAMYAEMRERLLREARAAGRLRHPGIVSVLDAGTDESGDTAFIAMELVKGRDLEHELRSGRRFTPEEAAALVADAADALDHAHSQGIVHRDIKPGNLLRDESGKIQITDFGIAHLAESSLTQAGQVLGSPAYMSPEQITANPVDGRSDLFSLGVVLYQLVTGERPFLGEGLSALSYQIVHVDPIPARRLQPALPEGFDAIFQKTLAKAPAQRYARAGDLARDLRAALVPAAPEVATIASAPVARRVLAPRPRPSWPLALAAAAVLVAGAAAYRWRGGTGETADPDPAVSEGTPIVLGHPASASETARLLVDFEHHLSSGSVTVSIDGEDAWNSPLRARKQTRFALPGVKKAPSLKLAHEAIHQEIRVVQGVHRVLVSVRSLENDVNDSETRMIEFAAGRKNVLHIRVSRLTREIDLTTEP